jgi:hypothetical protein
MVRMHTSRPMRGARRAVAALLMSVAIAMPSLAEAHKGKDERGALATVRFERTKDGKEQIRADVLLWLRLPPGERVRSLRSRFDLNRSGRLESAEAKLLGDELGAEVIGGYVLRYRGGGMRPTEAHPSARFESDGALTVVALLSYPPIPPSPDGAELAIGVLPPVQDKAKQLRQPIEAEIRVNPPLRFSPPTPRKATVGPGREPLRVKVFLPLEGKKVGGKAGRSDGAGKSVKAAEKQGAAARKR